MEFLEFVQTALSFLDNQQVKLGSENSKKMIFLGVVESSHGGFDVKQLKVYTGVSYVLDVA